MLSAYSSTALEDWVARFYQSLHIHVPEELDEFAISRALGIYLFYKECPSMSYELGRFKSITLDARLSPQTQREHFYHELCHILRHAGRQFMMPQAFRELQERDARLFTGYAALPLHMLQLFDLRDPDLIDQLVDRFRVSPRLCRERLQRIEQKMSMER